jgi:hypothetical protein
MAKKSLLLALFAVAFAGSAAAQTTDPQIRINVTAVGTQVTASASTTQATPDQTYVAYVVQFVNGGGSELRQTVLRLAASASDASLLSAPLIQPQSVNPDLPAQCSVAADGKSAVCDFSTAVIPSGVSFQFPVIVSAPQFAGAAVPGLSISLVGEGTFREGKSGSASDNSLGYTSGSASHGVSPLAPDSVDSVVVKAGGKLFTGAKGLPSKSDPQSTEVTFPGLTSVSYGLVNITESPVSGPYATTCAGDRYFRTCFETSLSAPAIDYGSTGLYLTETLRAHPDNILKSASQMSRLVWFYTPTGSSAATPIGQCASPTSPRTDGLPCQVGPGVCYTKLNAPSADLIGVCEWTFINTRNGLIRPLK